MYLNNNIWPTFQCVRTCFITYLFQHLSRGDTILYCNRSRISSIRRLLILQNIHTVMKHFLKQNKYIKVQIWSQLAQQDFQLNTGKTNSKPLITPLKKSKQLRRSVTFLGGRNGRGERTRINPTKRREFVAYWIIGFSLFFREQSHFASRWFTPQAPLRPGVPFVGAFEQHAGYL